jgi:hydroxyethylthiazole kinase-like uncharacterized protein yjeF
VQREIIAQLLKRRPDSHKYDYGHVLVIGGSPGMVGAPILVGKAAMRTGAGLVTIASTAHVIDKLEGRVEEIMTLMLPSTSAEAFGVVRKFIKERKVSVIVIGPGLKVESETAALVKQILHNLELPIVIDASALGVLRHNLDQLDSSASQTVILTPHEGEFQRLTDAESSEERSKSKSVITQFSSEHKVVLVLKGRPTYVAAPDGSVYENTTGNPGLATAGTGDVLSGVIGGLLAQGIESRQAAEAGVYLHGLAGDLAAADKTEPGMIATDVIDAIPAALKSTCQQPE